MQPGEPVSHNRISPNLSHALSFVNERITETPRIAVVLGSGLGEFADQVIEAISLKTTDIPHYPPTTIAGHAGELVFGRVRSGERTSPYLLVFRGRSHYYESGQMQSVVFPIELAAALGSRTLLLTNAAGGINRAFKPGDLMLITDYLNRAGLILTPPRRTTSEKRSEESLRASMWRAPDLDLQLMQEIREAARDLRIPLREGTYCWLKGPSYETPAEIEMLRRIGADAVGMSTVPEILKASYLGLSVAGLSLISNLAAGLSGEKLSHDEVTLTARRVKSSFSALLIETILRIDVEIPR